MDIAFLTPLGGLVGVLALLTLATYIGRARRAAHVRQVLAITGPSRAARLPLALSLLLVPALLGLAGMQPVIESTKTRSERTDAQALFVLDTSRSMLASARPGAATRLERAREAANRLARDLPEVPVGLASFNQRMTPYVFATIDPAVIGAVLARSIGIERARPLDPITSSTRTTTLDALRAVANANYFAPSARKRLLVVFTDGEANDVGPPLARAFRRRPGITTIFVRLWDADERIYVTGLPEPGYTSDTSSSAGLQRASALIGGRVMSEDELGEVRDAAKRVLGDGPTRSRELQGERLALMPYVTLLALAPLGLVLLRRNV
jgi:hypothetical protein